MKRGPKWSLNWRRAEIRFTMEGVTGCLEIGVSGIDGKRRAFEVDVDPSKPYSVTMRVTEETKFGTRFGSASVKCRPPPPREIHHLLALALQVGDVGFNCSVSRPAAFGTACSFRRVPIGCGEGDDDGRPIGGDRSRRGMVEAGAAVTGPVADQAMAVGEPLSGAARDCGLRGRTTAGTSPRAGQGWNGP
jgi:hypothetical protein